MTEKDHFFLCDGDQVVVSKGVVIEGNKVTALYEGAEVVIFDEDDFSSTLTFENGKWVEV